MNVIGGIAVGLAVGYVVRQVRRRVDDAPTEVAIALLSGYLAYLPASAIGVSGVLAAVTIGVYMGWYTPQLTTGTTRISGNSFWEILTFLVNALLFALVGLQLHGILDRIVAFDRDRCIGDAAIVALVVIVIRLVWVPIFTYVPRLLFRSIRERDPYPPWQAPAVIAWAGIRGAVSLAAALALPTNFPGRDLIVFLTFAVILVTLVGQGLSLPWLIRVLRFEDDGGAEREDAKARDQGGRGRARAARGARGRRLGARGHRRADARAVPLPHEPFPRPLRRRRRRRRRGALAAVPAAAARAARRRAAGRDRAAQRGHDHRGGDAARPARHRPRGLAPRSSRRATGTGATSSGPRRICVTSPTANRQSSPDVPNAQP